MILFMFTKWVSPKNWSNILHKLRTRWSTFFGTPFCAGWCATSCLQRHRRNYRVKTWFMNVMSKLNAPIWYQTRVSYSKLFTRMEAISSDNISEPYLTTRTKTEWNSWILTSHERYEVIENATGTDLLEIFRQQCETWRLNYCSEYIIKNYVSNTINRVSYSPWHTDGVVMANLISIVHHSKLIKGLCIPFIVQDWSITFNRYLFKVLKAR